MGRLLVVFEELETFSKNEWIAVSGRLKRYTTSNTIDFEDKNEKKFQGENINNYIINTNVDALKDSEGRRIFILDLSTKRKNDREYFGMIRTKCFNYEVGEALFNYFLEVETTDFNAQAHMPITKGKLEAIAERLDDIPRFLKHNYVLKNKSIKCIVDELFNEYLDFCLSHGITSPKKKIKFCSGLRDFGIDYRKSDRFNIYDVSNKILKDLSDKEHWIHELDDVTEDIKSPFDHAIVDTRDETIKQQKEEIEKLKKELEQLKTKPKKNKVKMTIEITDEDLEKELENLL